MPVAIWIVLGVSAGFIAFYLTGKQRDGWLLDVLVSILGATAMAVYVVRLRRRDLLKAPQQNKSHS